jgi:HSP20 family molecular chaperone IbpA
LYAGHRSVTISPEDSIKKEKGSRNMPTNNSQNAKSIKIIEPATTLIDEGKILRIITKLPGIAEEKIKIDLENHSTSVTIVATDSVLQYKKVITIPCEVRFCKKRFSDGVLELTLEKNGKNGS